VTAYTYIATDFRQRFQTTLPESRGSLSADVEDIGNWCAAAREAIVSGAIEDYFGADPIHDLEMVAAQTSIINAFLTDQGFSPPETKEAHRIDPMGMLASVAEFYRKVAPLLAEPNRTVH
jgi:hypothetical protein